MDSERGKLANQSGKILEQAVTTALDEKGFTVLAFANWTKNKNKYGNELLLTNAPYKTIYGHKGRTGLLLQSTNHNLKARIECKWQQSFGSVDEKFPYLYLNCIEAVEEDNVFIILDGDGYRKEAKTWLKQAIENKKYTNKDNAKNIKLFDLKEFLAWVNKNL